MFFLNCLALCSLAELPKLYASALTEFLVTHPKTIAFVEQPHMEVYDFVLPAVERFAAQVGFVVTSTEDVPAQFCRSTPCIVAFDGKKLLGGEPAPNDTLGFLEWVEWVIDPSVYNIRSDNTLRRLLNGSEPVLFAVDANEKIDAETVVYHVAPDLLKRCGVTLGQGVFVYRPQDLQFVAYNGSFAEQSKSKLIHISKWKEVEGYVAGFVANSADLGILMQLADEYAGRCKFMWTTPESLRLYHGFKLIEGPKFVVFDSRNLQKLKWFATDAEKFGSIEYLRGFLDSVFKGEVEPAIVSEAVPSVNDSALKQIVGSNFAELVYDDAKEVLVLFMNDNCASIKCKMLQMVMNGAATLMKKNERVCFYWINVDRNDLPESVPEIRTCPSIMMWPAGKKADPPEVFHGDSTISEFVEFMSKTASHSFEEAGLDMQKVKDKFSKKVNEFTSMFKNRNAE